MLTERQALDAIDARDLQVVRDRRGLWQVIGPKGATLAKDAAALVAAVEQAVAELDAESARNIASAREAWLRELERGVHPRPIRTDGVVTWELWSLNGQRRPGGPWSSATDALAALVAPPPVPPKPPPTPPLPPPGG